MHQCDSHAGNDAGVVTVVGSERKAHGPMGVILLGLEPDLQTPLLPRPERTEFGCEDLKTAQGRRSQGAGYTLS